MGHCGLCSLKYYLNLLLFSLAEMLLVCEVFETIGMKLGKLVVNFIVNTYTCIRLSLACH